MIWLSAGLSLLIFSFMSLLSLIVLAAATAPIGMGLIGKAAMEAIGRNPAAAADIKSSMILALVFCEFTALIGAVALFL